MGRLFSTVAVGAMWVGSATAQTDAVDEIVAGIGQTTDEERVITRAAVEMLRSRIPPRDRRRVRVVPESRGAGVRVFGIRRRSIASAMGLRNGDVVQSVGGRPVTADTAKAEALIDVLVLGTTDTVTVRRRGRVVTIRQRIVDAWPEGTEAAVEPSDAEREAEPEREERADPGRGENLDAILAGIERRSSTHYVIRRSTVNRVLENQAVLMRSARVVPAIDDAGNTIGLRLYGIRGRSLLGRLGLRNGDTLRTINGHDISNPEAALRAYSRLRGASDVRVGLERRGEPLTIRYTIRGR